MAKFTQVDVDHVIKWVCARAASYGSKVQPNPTNSCAGIRVNHVWNDVRIAADLSVDGGADTLWALL